MQSKKNNYGKYVSFLILIFMLTFIPNVSAETTKYKCIHYIEKDGKRVTLLESTWKKMATGKYTFDGATPIENDYYKVKASNSSDYEPNGTCLNIAPYLDKDDSSLYFSFLTGINKNPLEGVKVEQVFINDTEMTGCSLYDNSQETCNKQSNCEWRWVNESAGDGYCWTKDTNSGDTTSGSSGKDTSKDMDDKCDVLPSAIKKYINDALNLIKWVGLVLMIVLGTLDFIKAAAADDQDALKKASKHFMYRLIAVIILFLLPLFIEIILNIAGLMKYGAECWQFGK